MRTLAKELCIVQLLNVFVRIPLTLFVVFALFKAVVNIDALVLSRANSFEPSRRKSKQGTHRVLRLRKHLLNVVIIIYHVDKVEDTLVLLEVYVKV